MTWLARADLWTALALFACCTFAVTAARAQAVGLQANASTALGPPLAGTSVDTVSRENAAAVEPATKPLPSLAAVPVDIGVRRTVPAQEEEVRVKSSLDYEREAEARAAAAAPPPWAQPKAAPWALPPGESAVSQQKQAAALSPTPVKPPTALGSSITIAAFTGSASAMRCQPAGYKVIIDAATLAFPRLCLLPDGSFRFAP